MNGVHVGVRSGTLYTEGCEGGMEDDMLFMRSLFKAIDAFKESHYTGSAILISMGLTHEDLLMEVRIKK
jgi:hypothetical protein